MSKKTIIVHTCDRCGRDISKSNRSDIYTVTHKTIFKLTGDREDCETELCRRCAEEAFDFLRGAGRYQLDRSDNQ